MNPDKPSRKSLNTLNIVFVILFLVVLGCSCPRFTDLVKKTAETAPSSTPYSETPTSANTAGDYDVTMAKYDQINVGTPRADVERILGGKGTEISDTTGGGVRFTVNKWEGEAFKAIILTFRNDKVMTKTQVGLK